MLGLGLGMVMQVLVLAVQNSVDHSVLGVATSGSTMFRQIGGSIGVALFGTIFANRLHVELAARLPAGHARSRRRSTRPAIRHLPPARITRSPTPSRRRCIRCSSSRAASRSLAFVLTWLLREVPLQGRTQAGDAIPPPRDERERAPSRRLSHAARCS